MDRTSKTADLTEQLTKLSKLHTDGVLSDEEFKALKAKLIAGISSNAYENWKSSSTAVPSEPNVELQEQVSSSRADIQELLKSNERLPFTKSIRVALYIIAVAIGAIGITALIRNSTDELRGVACSSDQAKDLLGQVLHIDASKFKEIRTIAKDSDTGKLTCAANVEIKDLPKPLADVAAVMQMFTGGRPFTYNYTLEKTSDNQLYLSVFAPQTQQQLQPGRSDAQRSVDEINRENRRQTERWNNQMEDESRSRLCALGLC